MKVAVVDGNQASVKVDEDAVVVLLGEGDTTVKIGGRGSSLDVHYC